VDDCKPLIAGLATITPAAGFIKPWAAMVLGCGCAPFCYALVEGIKNKLQLDDSLDVFAVHGMGGYLGRAVQVDPMKPMLKAPGTKRRN
jgi:Amt family ammonium transporter